MAPRAAVSLGTTSDTAGRRARVGRDARSSLPKEERSRLGSADPVVVHSSRLPTGDADAPFHANPVSS
jgi:hypothetical protein